MGVVSHDRLTVTAKQSLNVDPMWPSTGLRVLVDGRTEYHCRSVSDVLIEPPFREAEYVTEWKRGSVFRLLGRKGWRTRWRMRERATYMPHWELRTYTITMHDVTSVTTYEDEWTPAGDV
jgi:hypothetical protein